VLATPDSNRYGGADGKHPPNREHAGGKSTAESRNEVGQRAKPTGRNSRSSGIRTHSSELKEERPLHPSWEAKRNLKQKEAARIVASEGKKIKFD
jgi:hypothetical protein